MPDSSPIEKEFLKKITDTIEDNISNEQFGVSELANEIGMSRSNLLRKIKKLTNLSVSQFIRQVRLQYALEILRENSLTVSEVSYKVGFNSTSYFIKCFHDHYGYPPGEVGQKDYNDARTSQSRQPKNKKAIFFSALFFVFLISVVAIFVFFKPFSSKQEKSEKSIAVLPFKNDSNDSSNMHIINGLMESILTNLQKIEDLRVISRTTSEKYRYSNKSISEIAKELDVKYFVEGSGQKVDDQIMLNIQLIEAEGDKHIWAEQYNREVKDIFTLQNEIARNIAGQIKVIIKPEEAEQINKTPTTNIVAYDLFLKGLDLLYKSDPALLDKAISFFSEAIEHDNEFARAHAAIAIAYYYKDAGKTEKKYSEQINEFSNKALQFDSTLPQSLIAKALFYMNSGSYELALPYFEKALEYNPNSALVIGFLTDYYANHAPDTRKYLEYALQGIRLNINVLDSATTSFTYLHLSNAFIQSGFVDEAERYINRSLEYNSDNLYSTYVKAYILYAKDGNLRLLNRRLLETLKRDTTRLDILQEVGKSFYFIRNFEKSYLFYKPFADIREAYKLNIYNNEDAKIAVVCDKLGLPNESEMYFEKFKSFADSDQSIYKYLSLAAYYSYHGEVKKAIEHLKMFSHEDNFHYWIILFLEIDPLMDNIKTLPEFKRILSDITTKFWSNHEKTKRLLEGKELL